jgi:polysaccharide deacetylase 2 family uncharacterized protein YibQ
MSPKDRIKALQSKLPPFVVEFATRHLSRFTPGFWVWSASTFVLSFIVAALLAKIFLSGNSLIGQAIETGQRVLIHVDSGEVDGNARHTKPKETAAPGSESTIVSKEGLAPAPFEAISAQTDKGLVPMVGRDGTLPWKYYARPFKGEPKRPIVAIVITHLGLSKSQTEESLKLPHDFTLSFSPYASDARKWARQAREEGFETLVDLPMQSADYLKTGADPGPYGLLEDTNPNERSARLRWVLSRFPGFVGTLAPEDESLTASTAVTTPLLTELAGHGVLFLYVKTPKNTALDDLTKTHQSFALGIDKIIDDDIAPGPIDKQLSDLTALAKTQGYAIGFAHSYPPTLAALGRWVEALGAQGVDLAPVSAVGMRIFP